MDRYTIVAVRPVPYVYRDRSLAPASVRMWCRLTHPPPSLIVSTELGPATGLPAPASDATSEQLFAGPLSPHCMAGDGVVGEPTVLERRQRPVGFRIPVFLNRLCYGLPGIGQGTP